MKTRVVCTRPAFSFSLAGCDDSTFEIPADYAGMKVFPSPSTRNIDGETVFFSLLPCCSVHVLLIFAYVWHHSSRGFRGVSGGVSEGFPRGFRGFPRVSATSRTARTVGISDFQPPKNRGFVSPL